MKTNKQWYPYEDLGSYFKLEEGTLLQCPMNANGTRDTTPCEVDWHEVYEIDQMNEVLRELEEKE